MCCALAPQRHLAQPESRVGREALEEHLRDGGVDLTEELFSLCYQIKHLPAFPDPQLESVVHASRHEVPVLQIGILLSLDYPWGWLSIGGLDIMA